LERFSSADEVLDFAIKREIESYELYTDLAKSVDRPWMRQVFEEFAREEVGHRQKLEAVKEGKILLPAREKIQDLKIADYVVEAEMRPNMDYQEALQVAMHKEKRAFRLYTDLAAAVEDEGLKNTFLALAQEEAKHKLRFEIEYDDNLLSSKW
jgi:rubrerythrin